MSSDDIVVRSIIPIACRSITGLVVDPPGLISLLSPATLSPSTMVLMAVARASLLAHTLTTPCAPFATVNNVPLLTRGLFFGFVGQANS